jgi:Family of unknown function (DUF5677)
MNYIDNLIRFRVQENLSTRMILQKILMANIELNDGEYLQIKEISKKMSQADEHETTFDLDFADKKKESEINLVLMTDFTDEDILDDLIRLRVQENLLTRMIVQKILMANIELNNEEYLQIKEISKKMLQSDEDETTSDLDFADKKKESEINLLLMTDFTDEDIDKDILVISETVSVCADAMLNSWKETAPRILREKRIKNDNFEELIHEKWGKAIDLLEILVNTCIEAGYYFNEEMYDKISEDEILVVEVITMLHGRACQLSLEILTLLKNGWSDSALARWRTLHEIVVTAIFIAKNGRDTAERYISHINITSYNEAKKYNENCIALGFEALPTEEIVLKQKCDELCQRFGKKFKEDNGWACKALGINNNDKKKPSFADIEKHVNLNHLKPLYKLASNYIHAGFKGVIHRIGTPKSIGDKIYVGPTIFGLTDAGQHMAISINLITSTLLSLKPTFARSTILITNSKLIKEMQEEFLKVLKEDNIV